MIHAAVLHGIGQTPRYEPFPAPVAGDGEAVLTATAAALKPSDRWMANGVHYAPTEFPRVMGLDRLGRLSDGTRVAFFTPLPPYGGAVFAALTRPELRLARAPSGSVTSRSGSWPVRSASTSTRCRWPRSSRPGRMGERPAHRLRSLIAAGSPTEPPHRR